MPSLGQRRGGVAACGDQLGCSDQVVGDRLQVGVGQPGAWPPGALLGAVDTRGDLVNAGHAGVAVAVGDGRPQLGCGLDDFTPGAHLGFGGVGVWVPEYGPGGEVGIEQELTDAAPGRCPRRRSRSRACLACELAAHAGAAAPAQDPPRVSVDDEGDVPTPTSSRRTCRGRTRAPCQPFGVVGFPGPPSEPDVRLSPHSALHVFMPLVRVLPVSARSTMVWGSWCPGSGIARWRPLVVGTSRSLRRGSANRAESAGPRCAYSARRAGCGASRRSARRRSDRRS